MTLLSSCEAFRWDAARLLSPLGFQDEGSAQAQVFQDSGPFEASQRVHRTKRHRELVRAQPHLVHHMAVPEVEESSHSSAGASLSQLKMASAAGSRVEQRLRVEDEMEVKRRPKREGALRACRGSVGGTSSVLGLGSKRGPFPGLESPGTSQD